MNRQTRRRLERIEKKQVKGYKGKDKDKVIEEEKRDVIRTLPPVDIKDETRVLLVAENINKIVDPKYKEYVISRLKMFYPDLAKRLINEEGIDISKECREDKKRRVKRR